MTVATDKLSEVSEDHLRLVLVAAGPPRIDQNALMIGNWLKRISATGIPVLFLSSGGSDAARTRPSRMGSPTTALKFIRTDRADDIAREAAPDVTSLEAVEAMLVPLSDGGSPVSKVRGAARWMKDNCHRSISVADAVHECELSERTLLRYFRSYYGKSPSDYLRSVRVDYARKLLSDTHLSADKIARQVGLANGDRLCKLFRRYIGMSPSGYRSRHRAAVATESQHSGTRA
jgi:AraC-like DNA-binding protein